jgi:hypothetical protein
VFKKHPTAAAAFGYSAVVAALHWNVLTHLSTQVLAGSQVGGLFVWVFWWFKLSLSHLTTMNPFYTKLLFFPIGCPVPLQSPLLLALALFLESVTNVYATTNLLSLAAYVGAGVGMFHVAMRVVKNREAAFLAGFVYMFGHYSLTQHALGHLNQAMMVFVPIVFLCLLEMAHGTNKKAPFYLLMASTGTCLFSTYFAFQVMLIGTPAFVFFLWRSNEIRGNLKDYLANLAPPLLASFLIALIFYWPILFYSKSLIGGQEVSSLSLLSFFDFPAWHPSPFIQHLRRFTSGFLDQELIRSLAYEARPELALRAPPENLMGFFSLTLVALLIAGARKGAFKFHRAWIGLSLVGILLALGPRLEIFFVPTALPLPYRVFEKLPFFGLFRSPARMILLTWTGVSVLAALSFEALGRLLPNSTLRRAALLAVLFSFSWEMGLSAIGKIATPLREGGVYLFLQNERSDGGLLELPAAVNGEGDISLNVQEHMLVQPLHGWPLVVGRPSRHTRESLHALLNGEFLYELVHPHTLRQLYQDPALRTRLTDLQKRGPSLLEKLHIQYVIFHSEDAFFSMEIKNHLESFLNGSLGRPIVVDPDGRRLYKVGTVSTPS